MKGKWGLAMTTVPSDEEFNCFAVNIISFQSAALASCRTYQLEAESSVIHHTAGNNRTKDVYLRRGTDAAGTAAPVPRSQKFMCFSSSKAWPAALAQPLLPNDRPRPNSVASPLPTSVRQCAAVPDAFDYLAM